MTNLKMSVKKINSFKNDLYIYQKNSADSFYFKRFELTGERYFVTDQKLIKNNISSELFNNLNLLKDGLV